MAKRLLSLDTGNGADDPAVAGGTIEIAPVYAHADGTTYIHASAKTYFLTVPASTVNLTVGQYYQFIPRNPVGKPIVAQMTAGSGTLLFKDLVPVDPSTLTPTADPGPAWFTALAGKQDAGSLATDTAVQVSNGSALDTALAAKILAGTGPEATARIAADLTLTQGLRSQAARAGAYRPSQADGLNAFSTVSGLTTISDYYAATVGGTDGTGIIPRYSDLPRASFRVKITKGTAGSKSVVGWCETDPAVAPTGTTATFSFGYLQGSGLGFVRENVGTFIAGIADASLTDGEEYDVHLFWDAVSPRSAAQPGKAVLQARWAKSDGTSPGHSVALVNTTFWPKMGNLIVRTNVATSAITKFAYSSQPAGAVGYVGSLDDLYYSQLAAEEMTVRVPANPNGLAVIACHGHGGNNIETGWTSTSIAPTWAALEAAGYTVFVPRMGGDLWGNDVAQATLDSVYDIIVNDFKLDPRVFLWGNSMGGSAALTAISRRRFPIRAARLIDPVTSLTALWSNPSFPTLSAAYGASTTARDLNNPIVLPVSTFAGVPMLFSASASDTTISKTTHTDAMRTRLGSTVENALLVTTGVHNDPDAFRAKATLNWFASHI